MPGPDLPEVPAPLKGIQHYLKIASEHDQRDPVVSYWARLYALQTGLKISTKTPAENNFLLKLMDWLEATKKSLIDNEAITNEVAAQAHLENWALKLFLYADKNDREGTFNKSVIQSFYTAGLLYDVLTTFDELTEEAVQNRKYAKWKAAYIHNCLKNGETPIPGPMKTEGEDDDNSNLDVGPGPDEDFLPDLGSDEEPVQAENEEESQKDEPLVEPDGENAEPDQAENAPGVDSEENQVDETPAEPEGEAAESEQDENQAEEPSLEPEGESAEPEQDEKESSEPGVDPDKNETAEPSTEPEAESAEPEQAEEGPSEPGIDPGPAQPTPPPNTDSYGFPSVPGSTAPQPPGNTSYPSLPTPLTPNTYNPTPTPTSPSVPSDFSTPSKSTGGATLNPEQMLKAGKYIKWAGSAINYDDVTTAIENLQKALHLLTTGEDS
ncbi:vacuolar protein sorting-associated protein VTA1 homolog isoform X2 [Venturia canescens]|uniref:vacuolar protein sorting-associated protein VTA1 homolog isoform X2 n=1 Tax=Venturia canescens TaxID=32260 RepID=UPI001C9C224E|nr:vacuolar protein sorting-associated protein VTA1 homolog isoform X2 [Venturia canescens]